MSVLNDLFVQIIQSEEKIRERFSKLRKVNGEIQDLQLKYQDFTEELKSLHGSIVLKNQHLAEEELNLKWYDIRGVILFKKRKELSETNEHLLQQKKGTEGAIDSEKKHFSEDVIQFTALLDFGDRGKEKQLTEAAQQIEELKSKEESLKQGSWNF